MLKENEKTLKYDKLLQYSLRLIAAKRYTVFELRKKLFKYAERCGRKVNVSGGMDERAVGDLDAGGVGGDATGEMIDKVIARLVELQYLDDKKFVENYVADRVEFKPRGKFLIKRELKLKGIAEKAIEECLKNLPLDEEEIALSTLRKRERLWQAYPLQKKKEKAFRYLASKGFEPDAIYKAVKRCYDRSIE